MSRAQTLSGFANALERVGSSALDDEQNSCSQKESTTEFGRSHSTYSLVMLKRANGLATPFTTLSSWSSQVLVFAL